jgi:hypothetical protein
MFVAGFTDTSDSPVVNPLQPTLAGNRDAFVTKIAFTPQEQVQAVIDIVNSFVTARVLNRGQGNSLIVKVQAVLSQLGKNDGPAACNDTSGPRAHLVVEI